MHPNTLALNKLAKLFVHVRCQVALWGSGMFVQSNTFFINEDICV
jgi:hypothetical protein